MTGGRRTNLLETKVFLPETTQRRPFSKLGGEVKEAVKKTQRGESRNHDRRGTTRLASHGEYLQHNEKGTLIRCSIIKNDGDERGRGQRGTWMPVIPCIGARRHGIGQVGRRKALERRGSGGGDEKLEEE